METNIVFIVCAVVSVVSAILVVTRRNPVYSALFLMLCFVAFAVLFLNLNAYFIAAMHMMVYTGAILVLFLFVIMLLNLKKEELGKEYGFGNKLLLSFFCVLLFAILAVLVYRVGFAPAKSLPSRFGSIEAVGNAMFSDFVLPFELLSILIIVAMIGGIILAKKKL